MFDTSTSTAKLVAVALAFVVGGAALAGAAAGAAGTASITFDDQSGESQVTIQSVTLPDGGYVVVKNESGDVVGHSAYLEAGAHEDVTVSISPALDRGQVVIAEAHADDGDAAWDNATVDGAYLNENGNPVTDTAYVFLPGEDRSRTTATATPAPSPTITGTAAASETGSGAESTPTASETTTEGPGFGIAVALVAVLGAVALLRRR